MEIPINTGMAYEFIVQQIFQAIHASAKTLKVERDVTLQGITGPHQIDVYWELESAGIVYKTIVQAKDWNKRVDKGELLKFKSVLDDLPGQPRGIFVTRTGYQSGAAEYAKAHGIELFELAEWGTKSKKNITITTLGWANMEVLGETEPGGTRLLKLMLKATPYTPKFDKQAVQADPDWWQELPQEVASALTEKTIAIADPALLLFYDESGGLSGNLDAIYRQTIAEMRKDGAVTRELSHSFSTPTFVATGLPAAPFMKINGISATISIERGEPVYNPFEVPNIVTFVFRNLSKGTTQLFQKPRASGATADPSPKKT